jgi:Zn-dependent protease
MDQPAGSPRPAKRKPDERRTRRAGRRAGRGLLRISPVPLGRLGGFPVYLSPAWLVLAALVTVAYRRQASGHLPTPVGYALGAAFVLCLLVSVFLHELGHALVCRRYGIGVRAITLEMLGGYTEMDRDAPRPRVELAVSLAGPGVSLALGGLLAGLAVLLPAHTIGRQLAAQVAASNVVVAIFNALPGLPLDGGRALRAVVWAVSRDPHRGNRIAGWAGWILAIACTGVALVAYIRGGISLIGAALVVVVAFTMGSGAGQAIRLGRLGARLPLLDATTLARPIFCVPAGISLGEARRRATQAGAGSATLAVADGSGSPLALVDEPAAAAVPAGRWEEVPVDALARGLDLGRTIPAGLRGVDVLRAVQGDPAGEYLVTSGEDVVGVLRAADVARLLRARKAAP